MKRHLLGILFMIHACMSLAANGPDVGDLWWVPSESGWGMQLVQNRDVLFATIFVYDTANNPVWYSGTLRSTGPDPVTGGPSWQGDLYATKGPWFGAPAFDPAQVQVNKVGTIAFTTAFVATGMLTYTVNGLQINKNVARQTLVLEDYNGFFAGMYLVQRSSCTDPADDGVRLLATGMEVVQSATTLRAAAEVFDGRQAYTCTFEGTYLQVGRMAGSTTAFACSNGESGTARFGELTRTGSGWTGRMQGTDNRGCTLSGSIAMLQ